MSEKITIYTKDHCSYCDRAKEYFKNHGIAYEEINIMRDPQGYDALRARTHHMTVPQIFIGEKFIGGYTDMMDKIRSSELTFA